MDLNKGTIRKIKELIVFTALVLVCLWKYEIVFSFLKYVLNILLPFIIGGAIAFVLNEPMNFFQRHLFHNEKTEKNSLLRKIEKPVSLIIVLICVVGVISLVMFVLIPQLKETFMSLGHSIQMFIPKVQQQARVWFDGNAEIITMINNFEFDWNKIMNALFDFFKNGAGSVVDTTLETAKNIVSGLTTFVIAFVFAIYILLQKEKLNIQSRKVLFAFVRKGRAEAILEVFSLTYSTFSSFLTGQCVEAVILGSMFVIAMTILKLPYALLVGIVIAFTALIPIFGAFVGCGIGTLLIFIDDPMKALIFLILFLVLQQIEGNFIYPKVVGNSVGLPSIWVLAAVSVGSSLMGIVGMLIFIPLCSVAYILFRMVSVIYALFREVVYLKLQQKKIKVEDIV